MPTEHTANDPCQSGRAAAVLPVEITLTDDPRLLAAVDTVVTQMALRAGLEPHAASLAAATVQICRHAFLPAGRGKPSEVHVSIAGHHDRIEIVVQSGSQAEHAAAKSIEGNIRRALVNSPVDRYQFEISEGKPRIVLIKFCGAAKPAK